MKTCPFCKEEIQDGAIKCKHCQSVLVDLNPEPNNSERITYVVDKGLLRFGKFVSAILALFIAVGITLYGYDLTKTAEELDDAAGKLETAQTQMIAALKQAEEATKKATELASRLQGLEEDVGALADVTTRRPKEFVSVERQDRVDALLAAIDNLPDAKAIELANNPPVRDADVDKVIQLRDPTGLRATDASIAREMLKFRAVMSKRDEEALDAWDAATDLGSTD